MMSLLQGFCLILALLSVAEGRGMLVNKNAFNRALTADPDCLDLPDLVYSRVFGPPGYELPDSAFRVLSRNPNGNSITFQVNQVFDLNHNLVTLAVHSHSTYHASDDDCKKHLNVAPQQSFEYTAMCLQGVAEVSIYVYVGNGTNYEPESCAVCDTPEDSEDFFQYYLEVDCNPEICDDPPCEMTPDVAFSKVFNSPETSLPNGAFEIVSRGDGTITFQVNQVFDLHSNLAMLAVHKHSFFHATNDNCDKSIDVVPNESLQYTAVCFAGIAEISIFVYNGDGVDFQPDECEVCKRPADQADFVQYYLEIECSAMDCEAESNSRRLA